MRHHPAILALTLLLASCATLRKQATSTAASTADTIHVAASDTARLTIIHHRDSTTTAQSHRRDSIIIRETITSTYDPATGLIIGQVIDRLSSQVSDITAYQQTIQAQQHIIDSLLTASRALSASHQADSTSTSSIREQGDAARTPWQSFLRLARLPLFALPLFALALFVAVRFFLTTRRKP